MDSQNFILSYVQSCASGRLILSDCGPVWQMGVIAGFLVLSVAALLFLRIRGRTQAAES